MVDAFQELSFLTRSENRVEILRQVEFVDELPKTSTRKVDKVALRDQFEDRTTSEGISPA